MKPEQNQTTEAAVKGGESSADKKGKGDEDFIISDEGLEAQVDSLQQAANTELQLKFVVCQLQETNCKLRSENNTLQSSLNNLQREMFLLKNPNNSNLRTSFPTKEEIFAEYIDLVEQNVINCAYEFSFPSQVLQLCKAVNFSMDLANTHYNQLFGRVCSAMYFPTFPAFLESKCGYEFREHMKENYNTLLTIGNDNRAEALKEIKDKQFAACLGNIIDRTFLLTWRVKLAGMTFMWFKGAKSKCKVLGNPLGKPQILFPPIIANRRIAKHGYCYNV